MTPKKPMKLKLDHLVIIEPITENQQKAFNSYKKGYNLCLSGSAGSGKTFLAMYLALQDVLDKDLPQYKKVVIVRSAVPTRDMGFLPGDQSEKEAAYQLPYVSIANELFEDDSAFEKLTASGELQFITTSFIRGITLDNSIVIVDEMQNCTGHEMDSIITRLGENSRFIMCGDYYQSDFDKQKDKDGILKFMEVITSMKDFDSIEFTWKDIVRSGLVREYIMTKEMMNIKF